MSKADQLGDIILSNSAVASMVAFGLIIAALPVWGLIPLYRKLPVVGKLIPVF